MKSDPRDLIAMFHNTGNRKNKMKRSPTKAPRVTLDPSAAVLGTRQGSSAFTVLKEMFVSDLEFYN